MRQYISSHCLLHYVLICDILYGESDMGSVIMEYDRELIAHKLQRWDKFITD